MQLQIWYEARGAVKWDGYGDWREAVGGWFEDARVNESRPFVSEAARWEAIVRRLPEADGRFFYGVSTTGIYCRPVCASRLPNRENVRFFTTGQEAENAGFRPCKRCHPQAPAEADESLQIILQACRMIDEAERAPTLQELAAAAGLSKYHFHRLFKKMVGVTPKQYAAEKRAQRVRAELQKESAVTDAIYNAGFESSSRFYETADASLGMKPRTYLQGGQGVSIRYAIVQTYLGWMLVAATERGLCKIAFGETPQSLRAELTESFPNAELNDRDPRFQQTVTQVLAHLEQPQQGLNLPLDIQGTAFQQRVWSALRQIPTGSTLTYSEVAAQIGKPKAVRAVAQACGANKIAVVIPCHRVVRSDGGLGGYRWGLERKQALLEREAA
jgi:AraC family transcriptional regulator of adaptative response/methylated-DNA-[protein]-cysteine methyltransferase